MQNNTVSTVIQATPQHADWLRQNYHDYQLSSVFQAIFRVQGASVIGYEGLLRANDSGGEPIAPGHFFEHMQGTQLHEVDRLARDLHLFNFSLVAKPQTLLFVNVHPETTIADWRDDAVFTGALNKHNIEPSRVCVEILESCSFDEERLADAVAMYRDLGCLVAMDDFGMGESNFDRVSRLQPDIVKIDRSLLIAAVREKRPARCWPGWRA